MLLLMKYAMKPLSWMVKYICFHLIYSNVVQRSREELKAIRETNPGLKPTLAIIQVWLESICVYLLVCEWIKDTESCFLLVFTYDRLVKMTVCSRWIRRWLERYNYLSSLFNITIFHVQIHMHFEQWFIEGLKV